MTGTDWLILGGGTLIIAALAFAWWLVSAAPEGWQEGATGFHYGRKEEQDVRISEEV